MPGIFTEFDTGCLLKAFNYNHSQISFNKEQRISLFALSMSCLHIYGYAFDGEICSFLFSNLKTNY